MAARALASATISFGLVSIPVKLFTAYESGRTIRFNQINKADGARVKQQLVSSVSGEPVAKEDIAKGYEFSRGQYVLSGASHIYVSQTDKGEILMGGDLDHYPSYSQRGNLPRIEDVASSTLTLFPSFGRLRILRTWAGIVDMTMDGSPLIDFTPVEGLYLNGGWNYGGFKAIPASGWAFAEMLATESRPALIDAYNLERFRIGKTLSEFGTGPMPQLQ